MNQQIKISGFEITFLGKASEKTLGWGTTGLETNANGAVRTGNFDT
ncbi:MAG TPA: hypothetical protein VGP47_01530 [Parachlamydiaceae bacterium]|nr:hypothetical protein [Nitrosopumilus sp.]HEV8051146.1 hypothetical protein [Parachlamydiaceae bacterium]